jgi:DNA-directed RNA polymerase specialized sigma24 family protein
MNEQLRALLRFLSDDPSQAIAVLDVKRRALVSICRSATFRLCAPTAHSIDPEDAAHDTLLRVASLAQRSELERTNVDGFLYRTAYNVVRERCREHRRTDLRNKIEITSTARPVDDVRFECQSRCLAALDPAARHLLRRYYLDDGADERASLAHAMDISINALRVRINSLRARLHTCRERCDRGEGVHL